MEEEKDIVVNRVDDLVGRKLGRHILVRFLGQGSSSRVYLGEHVDLATQAAIKVVQTRLSPTAQESFLSEAFALKEQKHPHMVDILDAGIEDDRPFLVMTYAPHGTLRAPSPSGTPLSSQTILLWIQQIALALQYVHSRQCFHGSIKPEKLLRGADDIIWLSHSRLAAFSHYSQLHDQQAMVGSMAYMAPEQLQGKPCPASDQYALGVVIYEWLTGSAPFRGSLMEVVRQHLQVPPSPLHEKIADISPAVEEVVLIALAKEPRQRFAHIQAFAHAFEQACQNDQLPLEGRTFLVPDFTFLLDVEEGETIEEKRDADMDRVAGKQESGDLPAKEIAQALPSQTSSELRSQHQISSVALSSVKPRSPRPVGRLLALGTLALLVILSSAGLAFLVTRPPIQFAGVFQNTPIIGASATAQRATSTVLDYTRAEASAEALSNAAATAATIARTEFYLDATKGTPILDDPLLSNDANRWSEGSSSSGEACIFKDGAYHVVEPHLGSSYPCFLNGLILSNFVFQAQVTILSGDSAGLVFLLDTPKSNYCTFYIYSDNTYGFYCYVNGNVVFHLEKGSIKKASKINLLSVIIHNTDILLYVNELYAGSLHTGGIAFPAGSFGLAAQNTTHSTEAAFSHVQIWQL